MTPEDYKFFDDCRGLFMIDGWRHFQKEIEVAYTSIRIESIESAEDFWKAKGKLEAFTQVANWESAVLLAEEQQEQDENE